MRGRCNCGPDHTGEAPDLRPDCPAHGIAVDSDGRFCGQDAETGEMTPSLDGLCGYCGPGCDHCVDYRVYGVQAGVWVCAADYEYEEQ